MKRRTVVRVALVLTPLVAFFLYAALNWFRIVEVKERKGMDVEALRQPYLAYSRLLERMGAEAQVGTLSAVLDIPPQQRLVMLGAGRLLYMTPDRVARLVKWVEAGGTLVVEAEPAVPSAIDDPLLDALGIERDMPKDAQPRKPAPRLPPRGRSLSTFDWQGTGERLRVEFPSWVRPLVDTRARPKLGTATVDKEPLAFSFSEGKGRVVVFTSLHFLRNGSIGHEDHAELGWQLATDRGRERGALLALRPVEGASLGEWLRKEAWPVSVAMAILLVLWLLRIVPRFGPLEPDPQPSRRRLGEHIAASGRFLASRGELAWLLDAARERVWQVAARRFAAARARKPETVDALADALGVSRFHAQRAFHMKPVTDEAFIGATSALQSIESRLHGKETK